MRPAKRARKERRTAALPAGSRGGRDEPGVTNFWSPANEPRRLKPTSHGRPLSMLCFWSAPSGRRAPAPSSLRFGRDLRAASSSADGCSGDLRCGPTHFASLVGRASAEARLRTQLGCVPLHVTNTKPRLRGSHVAPLVAGPPRKPACAPSSVARRCTSPTRSRAYSQEPRRFARGPGLRGGAPPHPARLRAAARHQHEAAPSREPRRFARGRASAEARLRTQLGCAPLHVTNPKPRLRGSHVASLVAIGLVGRSSPRVAQPTPSCAVLYRDKRRSHAPGAPVSPAASSPPAHHPARRRRWSRPRRQAPDGGRAAQG